MKTDLEILNEKLLRYRRTEDLTAQERLSILSDLEYYLHQVTIVHMILVCFTCFTEKYMYTDSFYISVRVLKTTLNCVFLFCH